MNDDTQKTLNVVADWLNSVATSLRMNEAAEAIRHGYPLTGQAWPSEEERSGWNVPKPEATKAEAPKPEPFAAAPLEVAMASQPEPFTRDSLTVPADGPFEYNDIVVPAPEKPVEHHETHHRRKGKR